MPDKETFTVVIRGDGTVVSVDGHTSSEPLSKNTEPITSVVVPLQILQIGTRSCINVGGQIICRP